MTVERPAAWVTTNPNLVAAYPDHIPMGLPLPPQPTEPDKRDEEYSL